MKNVMPMVGKTRANLLKDECYFCGKNEKIMDRLEIVVWDGTEGNPYNATVCLECHEEQTDYKDKVYPTPF